MIMNEGNFEGPKQPSASQLTHGLAQLGGGSKAEGGDGMMGGMQNIFQKGYERGAQDALEDRHSSPDMLDRKDEK